MCAMPSLFGAQEPVTCAEHSISASAVRTRQDAQAFVQCAYEYVQEEGFSEARRAFQRGRALEIAASFMSSSPK